MKKVYPQFSDFTENDNEIIENESYYFDMNTTWITKNETYIKFRAGDILVETNATVVIE